MEWSEEFESGLPEIDVQHRQIFMLIQRVNEVDEQNSRSDIRGLLVELERITRYHFECEERLMGAYDYVDLVKHTDEHQKLLLEVRGYQDNETFSPRQLTLVLSNWLMSHTLQEDRPLVQHILYHRAYGKE